MAEMHSLTLHGNRVAYRDEGTGDETLLLIHGIAGSSSAWEPLMSHLTTSYRVLAPDLLGHGASDKPRADYSLGAFAVWLRDFLDELDVAAVTVVGHSLGGGIALQFVHQHRAYCRRLVLINSGGLGADVGVLLRILSAPGAELLLPIIGSSQVARLVKLLRGPFTRQRSDTETDGDPIAEPSAWSNPQSRQAFLRTLRAVVDSRGQAVTALNKLHYISGLETLFIAGAQDRTIPPAHARAAHEAVDGSRLHILDAAGHQPHVECPDVVAELIREFIDSDHGQTGSGTEPRANPNQGE
jgi:pimeloyl-ACP methyl ester carboxylesterase